MVTGVNPHGITPPLPSQPSNSCPTRTGRAESRPLVGNRLVPTPAERPTLTIEEVARFIGISRSSAYEAAGRGEIPTLRFGRRLRVPTAKIRQLLALDPESVRPDPTPLAVLRSDS